MSLNHYMFNFQSVVSIPDGNFFSWWEKEIIDFDHFYSGPKLSSMKHICSLIELLYGPKYSLQDFTLILLAKLMF